ncbi:MAG: hypothetical protein J7L53_10490 [Deltaproteobacteria bacterium]|nr:hypothetical protein [Deltaproteobacteria bacterium]
MPQGTGLSANDVEGKDKRTMLIGNAGGLKDTDIPWAAKAAKAVFGEYYT